MGGNGLLILGAAVTVLGVMDLAVASFLQRQANAPGSTDEPAGGPSPAALRILTRGGVAALVIGLVLLVIALLP